ncbi:MAG: hydantoinase B/oxoprolinase family protein [bacterium]
MNPIALNIFSSRLAAVSDEMGTVLRNAAFSPNIRDRLDYSCAVFDAQGGLCAQAAHIPVHLGSMAYAMRDVIDAIDWHPGDQVILNDPYLGGTHLPDVTLLAPVFIDSNLVGFVANRAHHADIGAESPGSMPLSSSLEEEGLVIEPVKIVAAGEDQQAVWARIAAGVNGEESAGDIAAQLSANRVGADRLIELVNAMGVEPYEAALLALNDYAERLALDALSRVPDGEYSFEDVLDDDGQGHTDITIRARIAATGGRIQVDFDGTAAQVPGNINCPLSVAAAAVFYVFRCLMPAQTPACAGAFRAIELQAPKGSLLNANPPAAVAAGNVETSSRVVDVVIGALQQAVPELAAAASQGTMNNVAMGARNEGDSWDYYETLGGGMGAGSSGGGLSAVQTHMTNTLNTPVEVLETRFPLRVAEYGIRRDSGGSGRRRGGDGLIREFEFLGDAQFTLLTERRTHAPWGLAGGGDGKSGNNRLNGESLPGKFTGKVQAGDCLRIETPGGGGFGQEGEQ